MKISKKILTSVLSISVVCVMINPIISNAALQANGSGPASKNINDWMLQIRRMQSTGGTLGRTDSIDTTNLKSAATDLDIHMEKNTEYGAMAILSASSYGNPNKIEDGETSTGNTSGIVIKLNKEWVAAGTISSAITYYNAAGRYKNVNDSSYVERIGDAISETAGWHGSGASTWISAGTHGDRPFYALSESGLLRSYSGSIFSYYGYGRYNYSDWGYSWAYADAYYTKTWPTRAVIVVGTGL